MASLAGTPEKKTAIVTGASGGIGSGLVDAFLSDSYGVVAMSLDATRRLTASPTLVLVDGDDSEVAIAVQDRCDRYALRNKTEPLGARSALLAATCKGLATLNALQR